jgi:hypothetical protein
MQKQDRAFTGWLNHMLRPYTPDYLRAAMEDESSAALTDLRLLARAQGLLLSFYRSSESLRDVMLRVEARIDEGRLQMRDEVWYTGRIGERMSQQHEQGAECGQCDPMPMAVHDGLMGCSHS